MKVYKFMWIVELALQICRYLSVAQQKEYKSKMADSRDLPEME